MEIGWDDVGYAGGGGWVNEALLNGFGGEGRGVEVLELLMQCKYSGWAQLFGLQRLKGQWRIHSTGAFGWLG